VSVHVQYSHTGQREAFRDLDEALAALRKVFGNAIETEGELEEGAVLVWRDLESSKDDDGARAVARITASWIPVVGGGEAQP